MKIRLFLLTSVFAAFMFTACESTDNEPAPPAKEEAKEEEKK